ncbi:hypothetical protein TcWFU_003890 [Taenia crassiceps]|uniref:Uncharacterized protein n=1 Tax=Taenia crassiceps TaxID=6207 RepID=A0ABR4QQB2_9CEST
MMARKQNPNSSPSRRRGRSSSTSTSSTMASTLRAVFIDSSLIKGHKNPHQYLKRSQSLVRHPPYHYHVHQSSLSRGRSSRRKSFSCSSSSRSSSSSSSTSNRSSGMHGRDISPVRLIKVNPRSGKSVTKEGRMFVFDSKKYKIEALPGYSKKSQRHQHHHQDYKSGNWSKNGISYVVYRGKAPQSIYLVEMESGGMH